MTVGAYVLLVLGMGLVTYMPRLLPIVALRNMRMPRFAMRFLRFIPFAALGALIFPGILQSAGSGKEVAAAAGFVVCILLAYYKANIIIVVIGGIATVLAWQLVG
jgi:branched-subunit amino acid transport protein